MTNLERLSKTMTFCYIHIDQGYEITPEEYASLSEDSEEMDGDKDMYGPAFYKQIGNDTRIYLVFNTNEDIEGDKAMLNIVDLNSGYGPIVSTLVNVSSFQCNL